MAYYPDPDDERTERIWKIVTRTLMIPPAIAFVYALLKIILLGIENKF